jgi:hypothetical protein
LQKFTNAKIRINDIGSLSEITPYTSNQSEYSSLSKFFSNADKIHFYLSIDRVLTEDLIGRTVTFKLIVQTIKHRYPEVYNEVVQRSMNLCNVLD